MIAMATNKVIVFTVKMGDEDDKKDVKVSVRTPTLPEINEAQMEYNKAFQLFIGKKSQAPLRIEMQRLLEERGIWTPTKQEEYVKLSEKINEKVFSLLKGNMKKSEGRALALEIKGLREELTTLNSARNILDGSTAEAQAEQCRFNWLVSTCTVYPDKGQPVFKDLQDYLNSATEEHAQESAKQFSILQYGLDPDFIKKLPENAFLIKHGFAREKDARLVNASGQFINIEGKVIDEDGFLLNEDNQRVNMQGIPIDKMGTPIVDNPAPFLDD